MLIAAKRGDAASRSPAKKDLVLYCRKVDVDGAVHQESALQTHEYYRKVRSNTNPTTSFTTKTQYAARCIDDITLTPSPLLTLSGVPSSRHCYHELFPLRCPMRVRNEEKRVHVHCLVCFSLTVFFLANILPAQIVGGDTCESVSLDSAICNRSDMASGDADAKPAVVVVGTEAVSFLQRERPPVGIPYQPASRSKTKASHNSQ